MSFEETVCDFGAIEEADGPVSHVFRFTNTSQAPVVIERVQSSCGCTTPAYRREPVRPGEDGTIEVKFNPANFKGRITRTVTVFYNNGKGRELLTVKADITGKPRSQAEAYPFSLESGIRADRLHVPFAYIENGSVNSMVVELINTANKRVAVDIDEITDGGQLTAVVPDALAAGERAAVTITYDLRGAEPIYGTISGMVYLSIDGRRCELPITVSAIAVDNFDGQDPALAAKCAITPAFHNFGKVTAGQTVSKEIVMTNQGKSPLVIRNVSARRGMSTSLKEGTEIAAGGIAQFTVSLDATGNYGIITGGITIIVNEPEHPMREVRLAAEIMEN